MVYEWVSEEKNRPVVVTPEIVINEKYQFLERKSEKFTKKADIDLDYRNSENKYNLQNLYAKSGRHTCSLLYLLVEGLKRKYPNKIKVKKNRIYFNPGGLEAQTL